MAIRYLKKIVPLFLLALIGISTEAHAQTAGSILTNVTTSMHSIPGLFSGVAYLLGLFFAITGVFKFKDHVDGGSGRESLSSGVKRFIAGGLMFAAPFASSSLKGSLLGGTNQIVAISGATHAAPGGNGADQMIVDFINDISGPASVLITAFAYVSAILLLITGIVRLTKTAQEGPRGPGGLGTIMTLLASGALFSFGQMIGAFCSSLFGNPNVSVYANIDTTVIGQSAADAIAPVIEALMIFIMIVGFIAFLRGWFVLKAFADGSSQATVAQALTFLIGGALAINMGQLINFISATLNINTITFG